MFSGRFPFASPCFLGVARSNVGVPFLAWERASCPRVSGGRCPGSAPRRWSSPGHPAVLPRGQRLGQGDPLPFSLSAFCPP